MKKVRRENSKASPTRIIRGKEEVNGPGKPRNELVNSLGWLKGQ